MKQVNQRTVPLIDMRLLVLNKEVFHKVYTILDRVTPLPHDCGKECGAACCRWEAFDNETDPCIYLLPGENEYLESVGAGIGIRREPAEEHDLPVTYGEFVYSAYCDGPDSCDRRNRPIQCRSFPLMPYLMDDGELTLGFFGGELPYICPLIERKGGLSGDFVSAVYEAWKILIEDEAVREMIIRIYQ